MLGWCRAGLLIMEQVCMAALDCKAMPLALSIVSDLKQRFPDSQRAGRLAVCLLHVVPGTLCTAPLHCKTFLTQPVIDMLKGC